MEIHQLVPWLNYGDAVGNHALDIRATLHEWGHESEIFAQGCHRRVAHAYQPIERHRHRRSPDSLRSRPSPWTTISATRHPGSISSRWTPRAPSP